MRSRSSRKVIGSKLFSASQNRYQGRTLVSSSFRISLSANFVFPEISIFSTRHWRAASSSSSLMPKKGPAKNIQLTTQREQKNLLGSSTKNLVTRVGISRPGGRSKSRVQSTRLQEP